jgi:predicted enzyme related to lactoylglutathione lyase
VAQVGGTLNPSELTKGANMSGPTTLHAVVLDCADPSELAAFYRAVTGWEITYSDDDFVYLSPGEGVQLGFQRIAAYQGPQWPGPAKHLHVDLKVNDVEVAAKSLVELGANRPDFQPGIGEWIVLTDPAGHPFCVTTGQ